VSIKKKKQQEENLKAQFYFFNSMHQVLKEQYLLSAFLAGGKRRKLKMAKAQFIT
jgi:hypothetical protein